MYKHKIERVIFDGHAMGLLDKYLNDGWILLNHIVNPEYQHILVFQKYTPEKNDNVSEEEAFIKAKLNEMAFKDVFISE